MICNCICANNVDCSYSRKDSDLACFNCEECFNYDLKNKNLNKKEKCNNFVIADDYIKNYKIKILK
ncbi:hypothetical protein [Clostridium sp. BJN0001]|uniref:hypothetical protein n=1 Tax=Clostridium sp. BJN0001 TaxID=2930219 RepID=UPI001FD11EFE|nr:hypothetical protein [Clostridium sp. BJN0001]